MTKKPLRSLAVLLLALGQFTASPAVAGEPGVTILTPDLAHSFATATAGQFVVGIVGEGWAIRFTAPRVKPQLPAGVLKTGEVAFIRGPLLDQYIRPSAGPPTPPLPQSDAYSALPLDNITISAVGAVNTAEPNAYLALSFSRFAVGGQWFTIAGNISLPLRGPLP